MAGQLSALNPSAVLERGYAILTDTEGRALGGIAQMQTGDRVNIRMHDGIAAATIETRSPTGGN